MKIIAVLLLALCLLMYGCGGITGKVTAELKDKNIRSGKTTQLVVGVENTGKSLLEGKFQINVEDPSSVILSYPDEKLLEFKLYPGDKLERKLTVKGLSSTKRTDYEITVSAVTTTGKMLGKDAVTLSVRK